MSCGIGCRCGSDSELLWLCHRLAATALIRPLAWEPPYAEGSILKGQTKNKQQQQKKKKKNKKEAFKEERESAGAVSCKRRPGVPVDGIPLVRAFAAFPEFYIQNKQPYDIAMKCRKPTKLEGHNLVCLS